MPSMRPAAAEGARRYSRPYCMVEVKFAPSQPSAGGRRQMGSCFDPVLVTLKLQAELAIVDSQITVRATFDRLGCHLPNFLCDHADIGFMPAVIYKTVNAEPIIEAADKDDIMLESDVGSPSTAAVSTATAAVSTATAAVSATDGVMTATDGAMTATHGAMSATGSTMTDMRMPFRRSGTAARPVLHAVCTLAVCGLVAFATMAACRASARAIARIAATQVASIAAGSENLLAIAAAKIELAIAAIATVMLDMRVAVPIATTPAWSIDGDVIVVPTDVAAPITS